MHNWKEAQFEIHFKAYLELLLLVLVLSISNTSAWVLLKEMNCTNIDYIMFGECVR